MDTIDIAVSSTLSVTRKLCELRVKALAFHILEEDSGWYHLYLSSFFVLFLIHVRSTYTATIFTKNIEDFHTGHCCSWPRSGHTFD